MKFLQPFFFIWLLRVDGFMFEQHIEITSNNKY